MATTEKTSFNELRSLPNWVTWKKETRNGKVTKVPYNAYTGERAESDNPETWASYERASETLTRSKRYDGIGFMFDGKLITGIDLDHCVHNGIIDEWAMAIIKRLNSYAEFSPSETGIHILVHAVLPEHKGTRRKVKDQQDPECAIEIYDSGRYFTWTGRQVDGTPGTINDAQEQLTQIYQEITLPPQKKRETSRQPQQESVFLNDEQIIEKAQSAKNGVTFSQLWNGNFTSYLSQSEADQAFCNLLAFWCQKDEPTMDRIFRRSGLYRDKWDETRGKQTYGQITLDRAITSCSETYTRHTTPKTLSHGYSPATTKEKPEVIIGRQLTEMVDDAINALDAAEKDNPTIFVKTNKLVKIAKDKKNGRCIINPLGAPEVRSALARSANYYRLKEKGEELYKIAITPPKEIVESVVSPEDPGSWPFMPVDAIVNVPVIRPDGTVVDTPGYDAPTMIYYAPTPDLLNCQIPQNPTQEDAIKAIAKIEEIIAEFPFTTKADRANAIGAIFTPFIRQSLRGTDDVPIGVLDAASPGTGKSLLACIISLLAAGMRMSALPAPDTEEEWDKKIVTELMEGNTFIVIDNIPGTLKSSKLEAVLTTQFYKGRILGRSQSANPENRATWLATGNNLKLAGDLPERCYWIRMVATTSNPEARTFSIPDLMPYVVEHRCELVTAILTVIRAWYAAGKPPDASLGTFRTFTTWSNVIGSILHYAGIEGFLSDRIERKDEIDVDRKQWAEFLRAWHEKFKDVPVTVGQIRQAINAGSGAGSDEVSDFFFAMPEDLQSLYSEHPDSFSRRFGKALEKRVERRFGVENYYLQKGKPDRTNVSTWRVFAGSAGNDTPPTLRKKSEVPMQVHDIDNNKNHIGTGLDNSLHSLHRDTISPCEIDAGQPVKPLDKEKESAGSQNALPANENTPCNQNLTSNDPNVYFQVSPFKEKKIGKGGNHPLEPLGVRNCEQETSLGQPVEPVHMPNDTSTGNVRIARDFVTAFTSRPGHYLKLREDGAIAIGVPEEMGDEEFASTCASVEQCKQEIITLLSQK